MARPAKRRSNQLNSDNDDASSQPPAAPCGLSELASPSPSPVASFSSDKENHSVQKDQGRSGAKQPSSTMAPSSTSRGGTATSANKRRKLDERDGRCNGSMDPSQTALEKEKAHTDNKRYYDPEQSMDERRLVRRGFRDLAREVADCRNEYLTAESDGLHDTIIRANKLFVNVKQTSDATLDSRLLVQVGDLSARRAVQTKLAGSVGINVDDFVTKCVSFMRRGPSEWDAHLIPTSTQPSANRRRRAVQVSDDSASDDEIDEGDALNWGWLGVKASFPSNVRPPVPGFMLGPLSLQKRRRQVTQRGARSQRRDLADAARPDDVRVRDIERMENSNLKKLCQDIHKLLTRLEREGECSFLEELRTVEAERGGEISDDDEYWDLMAKHNITSTGGVCLFRFAFNPRSFGQTIENLFYISFLIRDSLAGIFFDQRQLPTLCAAGETDPAKVRENGAIKHQGVFHIDFPMWRNIVKTFEIQESLIPHREETLHNLGARGWYG